MSRPAAAPDFLQLQLPVRLILLQELPELFRRIKQPDPLFIIECDGKPPEAVHAHASFFPDSKIQRSRSPAARIVSAIPRAALSVLHRMVLPLDLLSSNRSHRSTSDQRSLNSFAEFLDTSLNKVAIIIPNPASDSPSSPNPAPSRPSFALAKLFPQPRVQRTPLVRRSQSCIQVPATLPRGNVTIFLEVIRRTNFSLRPARAQRTRGEPIFGLGGRIRYEVRLRRIPRRALCSIGRIRRARPAVAPTVCDTFIATLPSLFARKATIPK